MLRIDADLAWIKVRSMACQTQSLIPMAKSLAELQKVFEINDTKGVLIATHFPAYFQNLNVAGFHFHYLNNQKTTGGHVFDLKIKSCNVQIQEYRDCEILLPNNPDFNNADLTGDINASVELVERHR